MLTYRPTTSSDTDECLGVRARTRENALTVQDLVRYGVSPQSISDMFETGHLVGHVCLDEGRIIGFCSGDLQSGEIVVMALLPEYENRGIGKQLLSRVVSDLRSAGHERLFLYCNPNPSGRSAGFYRHLGWKPSGKLDPGNRDEELELLSPVAR